MSLIEGIRTSSFCGGQNVTEAFGLSDRNTGGGGLVGFFPFLRIPRLLE